MKDEAEYKQNCRMTLKPYQSKNDTSKSQIKHTSPRQHLKIQCMHDNIKLTVEISKNVSQIQLDIRKTCPCNIYPLILHFYTEKLGYARVYLFFLFLLQNIDCGYSLEPPQCFEQK